MSGFINKTGLSTATIRTGITSADSLSELSRDQWPMLMELRRMFCNRSLPGDCRLLLRFIEDGRAGNFAGFDDETSYIRDGLGLDPEAVRWAVEGLEITGSDVPVPFADAIGAGKSAAERIRAAATATTGDVLPADGSVNPGNAAQFAHHTQEERAEAAGTSRRTQQKLDALARRAPELLEQVKAGDLSVHAAAKAAGIVRDLTPLETLKRAWIKASDKDRQSFRNFIDGKE